MTLETLNEAIKRLIIKRAEAHSDETEQKRINAKLTKLYDLKAVALEQQAKVVA